MYMSVAKDAERVSDLSKNIFGIAESVAAPGPGPLRDDLIRLHAEIAPMIDEAARIFGDDDVTSAHGFIDRARSLQAHCRGRIDELLRGEGDTAQPVAAALTYRHLSRIASNLLNVTSAVVVPLDRLDYPDDEAD